MERPHYIYKISHKGSGKVYVGQTIDIERRWREHCASRCLTSTDIFRKNHTSLIRNAILKHGKETFTFEVLETTSQVMVNDREIHHIKEQGALYPSGYCISKGGNGASQGHSLESRRKMSEAHIGKVLTEATRNKMSRARLGALNPAFGGSGTFCVPVGKYSPDGIFIEGFSSSVQAAKSLDLPFKAVMNTHIGASAQKNRMAYGYYWVQSSSSEFPATIQHHLRQDDLTRRIVIGTDADGASREYRSIKEAAKANNVAASNISEVLKKGSGRSGGCTWRYKEAEESKTRYTATDAETGEQKTFNNILEAAKAIRTTGQRIRECLERPHRKTAGYTWTQSGI
jgi:group I intron endonuclease